LPAALWRSHECNYRILIAWETTFLRMQTAVKIRQVPLRSACTPLHALHCTTNSIGGAGEFRIYARPLPSPPKCGRQENGRRSFDMRCWWSPMSMTHVTLDPRETNPGKRVLHPMVRCTRLQLGMSDSHSTQQHGICLHRIPTKQTKRKRIACHPMREEDSTA